MNKDPHIINDSQISEEAYKQMKDIYASIIEPIPEIQRNSIYAIQKSHKYPKTAIKYLKKAIILLYQILKKMYDTELQQDCNPFDYIIFNDPTDYTFLNDVIKEVLKDE